MKKKLNLKNNTVFRLDLKFSIKIPRRIETEKEDI